MTNDPNHDFKVANGTTIPEKGTIVTPMLTQEKQSFDIRWKHADVEIPMLSTREIAKNNKSITYNEDDGVITHIPTGQQTKFISAASVHFIKLYVPKRYTKGGCCDTSNGPGVAGQGGR